MITQTLSISASSAQSIINNQTTLIAEISNTHLALLVKNDNTVDAFELYDIDTTKTSWQNIFAAIKNYSKILTFTYNQTTVYLNTAEALIIPAAKFSTESIETYLTAVFGNSASYKCNAEFIQIPQTPATIYRTPEQLDVLIKAVFTDCNVKHIYTKVLEHLLGRDSMIMEIIKVQFYGKFMLVTVVNNNKLQLVQSYNYNSAEDVIYYLLNIVQEFGLNVKSTPVEISGLIDIKSKHFELLENVFGRLSMETLATQGIFKDYLNVANAHYYTPFYNLSL